MYFLMHSINQINQTIERSLGKQKCVEPIDATEQIVRSKERKHESIN